MNLYGSFRKPSKPLAQPLRDPGGFSNSAQKRSPRSVCILKSSSLTCLLELGHTSW